MLFEMMLGSLNAIHTVNVEEQQRFRSSELQKLHCFFLVSAEFACGEKDKASRSVAKLLLFLCVHGM